MKALLSKLSRMRQIDHDLDHMYHYVPTYQYNDRFNIRYQVLRVF